MTKAMKASCGLVIAVMLLFTTACEQIQNNPKQSIGTLAGAGLGALAGSQFGSGKGQIAAAVIGALAGAWAGSEIGKSLDRADQLYSKQTADRALERNRDGASATWRNPNTGHSGSVTPLQTQYATDGTPCREFRQTARIGDREEEIYGVACRQADGSWRVVQ